jgi:hypothetical protein
MRVITKNEIEGFLIEKITKIILNKERESETIIEGVIINKDNAKVYLQGVVDSGRGKGLKEKISNPMYLQAANTSFLMSLMQQNFTAAIITAE